MVNCVGNVFVTFIELVMEGNWEEALPPFEQTPSLQRENLAGYRVFFARKDAEIRLVEPEVVIRRFRFNWGSLVLLKDSFVTFSSGDIAEELTVDEDLREGKRLKV